MRLSALVLYAVVLVASDPTVSKADQTGVPNVSIFHPSNVLAGEDKRFLRSHQTADDDDRQKRPEGDGEERLEGANLFALLKQSAMTDDPIYANKVFQRWKNYGYTADDVETEVTNNLHDKYKKFLDMWKKSGREWGKFYS